MVLYWKKIKKNDEKKRKKTKNKPSRNAQQERGPGVVVHIVEMSIRESVVVAASVYNQHFAAPNIQANKWTLEEKKKKTLN